MGLRRIVMALLALALLCAPANRCRAAYDMPYTVVVDLTNQIVTVYDAATQAVVRQMICSTGRNNYTPTGNFILPRSERNDRKPWYYIAMFRRYVKYATRIRGEILFHSLPYTRKSLQAIDTQAAGELGTPASHGCIRLRWQDAEFIARNCLPGTAVKITRGESRDDGLRELLYRQSFDASDGLPYESFLGVSTVEGALGRFSEGPEVLDLQYRLRDLGLYDGALNGLYDSATVNAVRTAQLLMGDDASGAATPAFREAVFAADAPTAMEVRLSEGMSGPAVRVLQDHLAALRLFTDPPDSVYDAAVVQAVRLFQRAYGYEADGVAAPRVQKAAAYEAGRLREAFGDGDYTCEATEESLLTARVSARAGLKLRESASQKSRAVGRLAQGRAMIVLERGGRWSRVRSGDDTGYVMNDQVAFSRTPVVLLRYTGGADGAVCAVGNAAADYLAGAKLPWEVFDAQLAANDAGAVAGSLVSYATADTGGPALNLRAAPEADAEILASVEDGTGFRVRRRYDEWTQVSHGGQTGYLLNRYLKFWTGPADALDPEAGGAEEAAPVTGFARVASAAGPPAAVYAEDADDAAVLGHLPDGTRVEVLEAADGWCRVRYEGREGYMIGEDLRLEPPPEPEPTELPTEELRP